MNILNQYVWRGAQESVFLTKSQVVVPGLHFKEQGFSEYIEE